MYQESVNRENDKRTKRQSVRIHCPGTYLAKSVLLCQTCHYGQNKAKQEIKCKNCLEHARNCKNDKRCKVCEKTCHEPGSKKCEQYDEDSENIVAFHGHKNLLSNFQSIDVNVNGGNHKSAEHAFQLTKALRNSDINTTERNRSVNTALDASRIGDTINTFCMGN